MSRVHSRVFGSVNDWLPHGIKIGFGTVYLYRTHDEGLLEAFSNTRVAALMSRLFVPVLFVTMLVSLGLFGYEMVTVILAENAQATAANNPKNMVAIPGVNAFLPVFATVYIVVGLVASGIVHEGAHGVAMLIEDIDIEEYGIGLLFMIPIAAYVLPDEEMFESVSSRSRMRVLSAGVFANIVLTILVTVWFFLPWTMDLLTPFLVYFGILFGMHPPTPALVHALGPVVNTLFWIWFFNLNIGILNALPVIVLDGGRVIEEIGEMYLDRVVPGKYSGKVVVAVTTTVSVGLFVMALFGPYIV